MEPSRLVRVDGRPNGSAVSVSQPFRSAPPYSYFGMAAISCQPTRQCGNILSMSESNWPSVVMWNS